MPIDALRDAIAAEARARAAEVLAQAAQQAAQLRAAALAARDRRLDATLRAHEEELREELSARLAASRRALRARVFAAREALLDRVFEAAQQALRVDPADPSLREAFETRLRSALAQLEDERVVECAPAFVPIAEALAADDAGVRVAADPALAVGFRVRSTVREVEIDATLPQLLALQRPQLAIAVLAQLEVAEAEPVR